MNLARLIEARRVVDKESIRTFAKRLGIETTALWRFEQGKHVDARNLAAIIKWCLSKADKP